MTLINIIWCRLSCTWNVGFCGSQWHALWFYHWTHPCKWFSNSHCWCRCTPALNSQYTAYEKCVPLTTWSIRMSISRSISRSSPILMQRLQWICNSLKLHLRNLAEETEAKPSNFFLSTVHGFNPVIHFVNRSRVYATNLN